MNASTLEKQNDQLIVVTVKLLHTIFKYKWIIVLITLAGAGLGYYKTRNIPYVASTVVSFNKANYPAASGGLKELGLSAIVGSALSIPMEDVNLKLSLAIMKSRSFAIWAVNKYNLVPKLVPVSSGDTSKDLETAIDVFQGGLKVNDRTTLYNNLEVIGQHKDRNMATLISTISITAINEYLKSLKLRKTATEIEMLNATLKNAPVLSVKYYLFSVISQKVTEQALTESKDDFFLTVIDPPMKPKKKEKPLFIVATYLVASFIVGCATALLFERLLLLRMAVKDEFKLQRTYNN